VATITGTSGNDNKTGTTAADIMSGLGGNDTLKGGAGNDQISGGTGLDSLYGEAGNDILKGDDGNDSLWGGDNDDVLYGGIGDDNLYGDAGTDTLKGEAGNDTLKNGTGLGYMYGGDGNDQLYYDPTTENLSKFGSYFERSLFNGDAGTDTLNLFNHATYTDGTVTKAAQTQVGVDYTGKVYVSFLAHDGYPNSFMGTGTGIEKIVVTGTGGLVFSGSYENDTAAIRKDVTGTAAADTFYSYAASDTMRGGGGNDTFHFGGGADKIVSETNDADNFYFDSWFATKATITGFNGVGFQGGDRVFIDPTMFTNPATMIKEVNGTTVFSASADYSFTVDKVGLVEGVDWFFI
jgi:Ca2+-binding RTX toxin-like protein